MCSTDYDPADIYNEKVVKARKNHICSECSRNITKDEKYKYHFGIWENKPSTFKTCRHCLIAQDWLREECGGFLHGQLRDEIYEHADGYRKMFLYRLVVGMDRKWKNLKSDNLMEEIKNGTSIPKDDESAGQIVLEDSHTGTTNRV